MYNIHTDTVLLGIRNGTHLNSNLWPPEPSINWRLWWPPSCQYNN